MTWLASEKVVDCTQTPILVYHALPVTQTPIPGYSAYYSCLTENNLIILGIYLIISNNLYENYRIFRETGDLRINRVFCMM